MTLDMNLFLRSHWKQDHEDILYPSQENLSFLMMVTKLFLSPLLVNSRWSKLNRNKLLEFSKQNEQQNALRIQQMELNSYLQIQLFTPPQKKKKGPWKISVVFVWDMLWRNNFLNRAFIKNTWETNGESWNGYQLSIENIKQYRGSRITLPQMKQDESLKVRLCSLHLGLDALTTVPLWADYYQKCE